MGSAHVRCLDLVPAPDFAARAGIEQAYSMILQLYQKLPHYLSILSSALLALLNQSYNHYLFLRVNMSPPRDTNIFDA
jgi:hypothetical protein